MEKDVFIHFYLSRDADAVLVFEGPSIRLHGVFELQDGKQPTKIDTLRDSLNFDRGSFSMSTGLQVGKSSKICQ